jgi:hypothetical protein
MGWGKLFAVLLTLFALLVSGAPALAQTVDLLAEYRFENSLQPLQPGSTLTAFAPANE